jgi:hypothetical protein
MTAREFLALPNDGVDRWLIRGEMHEWPKPMRVKDRAHAFLTSQMGYLLSEWVDRQPWPRGEVHGGQAGCWLGRDPETISGSDVLYVAPELAASPSDETDLIPGVPTLAVEILSPWDTQDEIHTKIETYLEVGVPLVWVISPYDRTVRVYRPDAEPELFNVNQELSGDPHLPGFRVRVASIFSR